MRQNLVAKRLKGLLFLQCEFSLVVEGLLAGTAKKKAGVHEQKKEIRVPGITGPVLWPHTVLAALAREQ